MHSPCDPPKFVEQDFSKFDFSRWQLDGLTLDWAAEAFAGLAEHLVNSEEWHQHFKATLPELQRQALVAFKDQSRQLKEQRIATIQDFDKRMAASQQRTDDFRQAIETAGAPTVVEPISDAYQLVVKVVDDKDPRLGLPGLAVQMIDPRNENAVLVESVTDHNGNAVLFVPPNLAKERDKGDTTLQILDPTGKQLTRLPNGVPIRVGQTETKVVKVPESAAIAEHKGAALQLRKDLEVRARQLAGQVDVLKREREIRLKGLDCRLRDNEAIIAELEKPEPQAGEPKKEATDTPPASSKKKDSGSKKRRKKP